MQDSTTEWVVQRVMEVANQELEGLVRWVVSHREMELGQLEQGLLERGHQLLLGVLGQAVESSAAAEPWRERECAGCRRRLRALGALPKWLHTSLGHYWSCPSLMDSACLGSVGFGHCTPFVLGRAQVTQR